MVAKIAEDGIEVITRLGHRDDVELGIAVPRLAAHRKVFESVRLELTKTRRKILMTHQPMVIREWLPKVMDSHCPSGT